MKHVKVCKMSNSETLWSRLRSC